MHKQNQNEIASWLMGLARWNAFGTFTFELPTSVYGAQKQFEHWLRKARKHTPTFYAVEWHPGGHGAHVHSVMDLGSSRRREMWGDWFNRFGRNSVLPIEAVGGVTGYCSKYCVKDAYRNGWWNVLYCSRAQVVKMELPVQRLVEPCLIPEVDRDSQVRYERPD